MQTRTLTLIFMAVVVVAIIVYDSLMATNGTSGDTISEITLAWATRHLIAAALVTFAIGVVFGHLFWPQTVTLPPSP